jgi:hypothetical protein
MSAAVGGIGSNQKLTTMVCPIWTGLGNADKKALLAIVVDAFAVVALAAIAERVKSRTKQTEIKVCLFGCFIFLSPYNLLAAEFC